MNLKTPFFAALTLGLTGLCSAQNLTVDGFTTGVLNSTANVSAISINPVTGDALVRGGPAITSCSVEPTNILGTVTISAPGSSTAGAQINVSWSTTGTTVGSNPCTPSFSGTSGSSGWPTTAQGSSGSVAVTLGSATTANYTFRMSCAFTGGAVLQSATTFVAPVTSCGGQPAPNWMGAPLGRANLLAWSNAFAEPFPRRFNFEHSVAMGNGVYHAIEFIAVGPSFGIPVSGLVEAGQATFSTGGASATISDCEGDFSAPRLNVGGRNCFVPAGGKLTLQWTTDASTNPSACLLTPGQRYFYNITYGVRNASGSGEPWCPDGTACVFKVYSRGF